LDKLQLLNRAYWLQSQSCF